MARAWKIAGINFDHMHMGDLLRMVRENPSAELVGICDEYPARMDPIIRALEIPHERVFNNYTDCIETTKPDIVILCPATAKHAEWAEKIAPFDVHILIEKPFAVSLSEADRMIAAVRKTGKQLAINWPLRWYPPHITAKRLVDEALIGELVEVHYYDGNRGPLSHAAEMAIAQEAISASEKAKSWFYRKADGGGSLQDYLGYGTTLGSWYMGGRSPLEITTIVDQPKGIEVDEHSLTVARYESGLSTFQTRWGTFTDPWTHQPQPKCGFVLVGRKGTISSYDYEHTVRVQTREKPAGYEIAVDEPAPSQRGPINYFLHCLNTNTQVEGPLSPRIARIGQQIIEGALMSVREKRTVPLPE